MHPRPHNLWQEAPSEADVSEAVAIAVAESVQSSES